MSYPIRLLVVLSTLFLAPCVRAQDNPSTKPTDARQRALVRAGYTPVPLGLDPSQLSFSVDGAVGPEKMKFDLDSGSTDVFLDLKLARKLKLKLGAETPTTGLGGQLVGRRTFVPGIKIGAYDTHKDWPHLAPLVSDLSSLKASTSGVLGMQVLDPWAAVLDYPARTLYLRPPLTTVWPRLAGSWKVTSWHEDGSARKLNANAPPTLTFADRRLKLTDNGKTDEYGIRFVPYDAGDCLFLFDPKEEGKLDPVFIAGGRVRVKDDTMTACLCLETDKPRNLPTGFDAPKGSGLVLLELKHTTPQDRKPLADPLRELLLKDGYTAVRMDRELDGKRRVIARTGQHDFRLLVDTGSSASMFDAAGLGKWGAKRLGATEGQAWRGKVKFEEVHLRGLTLGKFDTRSAWAVVYGGGLDLAELNKAAVAQKLKPIQGLLGNQDLLNGSAVMDFGTNTLYLRPVKETFGPQLEGKWVGVTWEYEGKKGRYKQGDSVVEFKGGRVRFADGAHEWGFHLQDEGDCYRLGLFEPKTDELAESFKYSSGGLLKLTGGTLTLLIPRGRVREEPTEFAAPKGSGLLLVDFERAK